jgi:hypothetical protein
MTCQSKGRSLALVSLNLKRAVVTRSLGESDNRTVRVAVSRWARLLRRAVEVQQQRSD